MDKMSAAEDNLSAVLVKTGDLQLKQVPIPADPDRNGTYQ